MYPLIQMLPGHYKRFFAGYPWVYANEIVQSHSTKNIAPGSLVQLEHLSKPIATGYFNRHSLIAFRVLSRIPTETIDANFFHHRLLLAKKFRDQFFAAPFYRLIHAEADGLPGLIIDRFDDVLIVQINTHGMEKLKEPFIQALQSLFNPSTIYIKNANSIMKCTTGIRVSHSWHRQRRRLSGGPCQGGVPSPRGKLLDTG